MSKFEKKAINKINLTEGFLKLILRTLTASAFQKALQTYHDNKTEAEKIDLKNHAKEFERAVRNFCKKYPKKRTRPRGVHHLMASKRFYCNILPDGPVGPKIHDVIF